MINLIKRKPAESVAPISLFFFAFLLSFWIISYLDTFLVGWDRGHRSDWLFLDKGRIGYSFNKPPRPTTVTQRFILGPGPDDPWRDAPLRTYSSTSHGFLGFRYEYRRSTLGDWKSSWLPIWLLVLITGCLAFRRYRHRLPFFRADVSSPALATQNAPNSQSPPPALLTYAAPVRYAPGETRPVRIASGIASFAFAGLIAYFWWRSRSTLGGIGDWILPMFISIAAAITFLLMALGKIGRHKIQSPSTQETIST
jgi:hypothetical protein